MCYKGSSRAFAKFSVPHCPLLACQFLFLQEVFLILCHHHHQSNTNSKNSGHWNSHLQKNHCMKPAFLNQGFKWAQEWAREGGTVEGTIMTPQTRPGAGSREESDWECWLLCMAVRKNLQEPLKNSASRPFLRNTESESPEVGLGDPCFQPLCLGLWWGQPWTPGLHMGAKEP